MHFQGGGYDSDNELEEYTDGKRFKICMHCFPFEVLSSECRKDINDIREIPSEFQVRQATTELYKKERNHQINVYT